MKITEENVYRILDSISGRGLTVKEMLSVMDQKKKRKTLLRKILRKMGKQKQCYKNNNRYFLKDQVSTVSEQRRGKFRLNGSNSGRGLQRKIPRGMVWCKKGQFCVYSFEDKIEYILGRQGLRNILHGDVVNYSFAREKSGQKSVFITEIVDRRIKQIKGNVVFQKKGPLLFISESPHFKQNFRVTNSIAAKHLPVEAWLDISSYSQTKSKNQLEGKAKVQSVNCQSIDPLVSEILRQNKISTRFSDSILQACSSLPTSVRYKKGDSRFDLRDLPFVTIDGDDAKDFDDAVYAEKEGDHYRVWVSIADVAEYVPMGSNLDKEAFNRGVSTYFPGTVYPMLPEALSNGLCSLKEGVNRKTLTCEMLIDQTGRTIHSKIYPSLNKITCRLTYALVDSFFETGTLPQKKTFPDLSRALTLYGEIAERLEKKRVKRGFISFNLPDTGFEFDNKNRIINIGKKYQTKAMKLIEQFMLEANETVGVFCSKHKIPIIWRNHPPPLQDKTKELRQLLRQCGLEVSNMDSGREYNQVLKKIKDSKDKDFLEHAMLRSMSLAVYEIQRKGHFGISASHYCHFTSPIRRYPDLMVHRALKAYFNGSKMLKIPEFMAAAVSEKERQSEGAERSMVKLEKTKFMAGRIGEIFKAKAIGFVKSGIFVEIDSPYVEGFVSLNSIYDDRYELDEKKHKMRGKTRRKQIGIGTELKVILTKLDLKYLGPEFDWICWTKKDTID